MPRKKSVAESVEHLLKPRALAQSDSEEEDLKLSESLANVSSKQRPSGILKKTVPLLHELDKKYKGVVASRKDFEDSEEEDEASDDAESVDEADSDEEEDGFQVSDQEDASEEDEDNDMGISDFISQFKSKVQKDVQADSGEEEEDEPSNDDDDDADSEEAEEEDGDSEEDDSEGSLDEDGEDEEEMDDDSEGAASESAMKILQPVPENNVRKGQAVRTQLDLWERILETRIKIQPVLNKANGFPGAGAFAQLQESSEDFTVLARDTQRNVASLLDNLIDLQNTMMAQFGETRAILESGLYKRKFVAELCGEEEEEARPARKKLCLEYQTEGAAAADCVFKTYRNSVIQKWSDRTKVTSARNSKELSLSHNVISQIEGVLMKKPDLIKNSQTHKGTYELFGQRAKAAASTEEAAVEVDKWCPEIYDDTDFYHQMLRELIEYKSNSSTNPVEAARNYSELQKLRTKIKKQVDQKASKGRKIR